MVDDMATSRALALQALEELRIPHVTTCNSGHAALDMLTSRAADLVIADYDMPEMDGLELLRRLRAGRVTRDIGFILVAGALERETVAEGQRLGLRQFLRKPCSTAGMKTCLTTVLGPF